MVLTEILNRPTVSSLGISFSMAIWLLTATAGCSGNHGESTAMDSIERSLPVVRGSQLNTYLQGSESPVLVEFGVDFNCPRCAQTKSDAVRLREALEGNVDVIRVDFNANAQMVAQLGGTVCPTYVLFDQGEPVITRSFPVSMDILESEILRLHDQ